jgi:hypothetical protein
MLHARKLRELTIDRQGPGRGYVSSASGLVRTGETIYVAADDERGLAVFPAGGDAPGRLVRFMPGELSTDSALRKREKPDLEALALLPPTQQMPGGGLLALESGSKPNRRGGVLWHLDGRGALAGEPQRLGLTDLYLGLEAEIADLNIEGATVTGEQLLLFQRGNGRAGVNAMIALDLATVLRALRDRVVSSAAVIGIRRHELGEANGVRLCFSDATALPGAGVLFTAVAEGGDDTYLDGRCTGSAVGLLTPVGDLDWIRPLDPPAKVEGIEAHRTGAWTELLLVADPDDPDSPAPLLTALLAP